MKTRLAGLRRLPVPAVRRDSSFSPALLVAAGFLTVLAITASLAFAGPISAGAVRDGAVQTSRYFAGESADGSVTRAGCPAGFVLDFTGLPAGTILAEQYASFGIHMSARANGDYPHAMIVFDSNASGTNDPDLEVDIGNISILTKDLEDKDGDGLVDLPDENNSGGAQVFTFDQPVHVGSFLFIDKDHGTPDHAIAYDEFDEVITTVPILVGSNASVQTINVNADNVRRLEIVYRDSGGLTGILIGCPQITPTATPSPTPTATPTPSPQPRIPTDPPTQTPAPPVLPTVLPPTGGDPGIPRP